MLRLFKVAGPSMQPAFHDGDRVLTLRLPARFLRAGMPVVVRIRPDFYVVKRLGEVVDRQHIRLSSDNPDTYSSCCDGLIGKSQVVGAVVHAFG